MHTFSQEMARNLEKLGIPCTTILDSAVGYIMEQVDMVMVGAEGVVESGGIINKVMHSLVPLISQKSKQCIYVSVLW